MTLTHDTGLTRKIIGWAMRVHAKVGPGLIESMYERCLCREFDRHGIPDARQVDLPLDYDGELLGCCYQADVVVRNEVLLELKSVEHIVFVHEAQLLTYLQLSGCRVGLLLNFNTVSLKEGIRRKVM